MPSKFPSSLCHIYIVSPVILSYWSVTTPIYMNVEAWTSTNRKYGHRHPLVIADAHYSYVPYLWIYLIHNGFVILKPILLCLCGHPWTLVEWGQIWVTTCTCFQPRLKSWQSFAFLILLLYCKQGCFSSPCGLTLFFSFFVQNVLQAECCSATVLKFQKAAVCLKRKINVLGKCYSGTI